MDAEIRKRLRWVDLFLRIENAPGTYQYTAIDDCTRVRVLAIYPRRTAANSLFEKVEETG